MFSAHDWQAQLTSLVTQLADQDGAHDLNHLHRVWHTAQALLDDYPQADALVVQTACYLHDLVNLPKNHPQRHLASRQAAQLAQQHLIRLAFPANRLAAVCHAIEAHSYAAEIVPETIEAQLVQDADRLDALGAVGLARLFYTAGRMGSELAHGDDARGAHRALDDRRYALDHLLTKLATLPARMNTAAARQLGQQRLQWLLAFRDTFLAEWDAGLS